MNAEKRFLNAEKRFLLNKLKPIVIREGKILAVSLVIGLLLALVVATYVYSGNAQRDIADNVIRFHVRANSDSNADLVLKEYVRTQVLAEFESLLSSNTCINETRAVLTAQLDDITTFAQNVVSTAGFDHQVTAQISQMFFPTQFYGSIAFPPGEYEAVKILIGEATGSNWWCLMFPPLCYVDMTATDSGRRQLADTVSDDSFRLLTHQEEESTSLRVRFRVVEWWQNRGRPADPPRHVAGR